MKKTTYGFLPYLVFILYQVKSTLQASLKIQILVNVLPNVFYQMNLKMKLSRLKQNQNMKY